MPRWRQRVPLHSLSTDIKSLVSFFSSHVNRKGPWFKKERERERKRERNSWDGVVNPKGPQAPGYYTSTDTQMEKYYGKKELNDKVS